MVAKGKGVGEGKDWECGISKYKLLANYVQNG